MTLAQLLRLFRRAGAPIPPPPPAPVMLDRPTISSPRQVGVLATVTPGTYDNVTTVVGYVWKIDGVQVASGPSYLPVSGDEAATTFTVEETVLGLGGLLVTASLNAGPILAAAAPPDPGAAFAGVDVATMLRRNAIVAEYEANAWAGVPLDGPPGTYYTDVEVTSRATLEAALAGLDRSDLSRFHRIKLVAGGSYNGANLTGASSSEVEDAHPGGVWNGQLYYIPGGIWDVGQYYGSPTDRASAGGGVLITSADPENPAMIVGSTLVTGYRGLHFYKLKFAKEATSPINSARDGAQMIVVSASATRRDAPVVRVEDCDIGTAVNPAYTDPLKYGIGVKQTSIGEQLDVINCRFNGTQTGIVTSGVRYAKWEGNDFQNPIGDAMVGLHQSAVRSANDTWDERVIWWTRKNTVRRWVDLQDLSSEHSDFAQAGTSLDVGGYSIIHEMEVNYAKRETFTDARYVTYSVKPVDGATLTVNGVVFTYRNTPTLPTDIQIAASTSIGATLNNAVTTLNAVGIPDIDRIVVDVSKLKFHFQPHLIKTVTSSVGSVQTVRVAGGTQGLYHDDSGPTRSFDIVMINCIMTTNDGIGGTMYTGDGITDRCVFARPGDQPPNAETTTGLDGDKFDYSHDWEVYVSSSRNPAGGATPTVNHTFRNSIVGYVRDGVNGGVQRTADATYLGVNSALLMTNNRIVTWEAGGASPPGAMMAGAFGSDAQGRVRYDFDDGGTQQEFRQTMYAQFMLANVTDRASIGPTNPATW